VRVIVGYDISDDRRRARVAARLSVWGDRIQESLFMCDLEERDLDQLLAGCAEFVDPKMDRLTAFPLCPTCRGRRRDLGRALAENDDTLCWIV